MKTLRNMLLGLFATALITNSSFADGADAHAGLYGGMFVSVNGLELDASATTANDVTSGQAGKYAEIGGLEAGYTFAIGDSFLIDIGGSFINGDATLKSKGNADDEHNNNSTALQLEVSDPTTYYIAPGFSVSDTSALYFKFGVAEANTKVTGDYTNPGDLDGTTLAFGTKTQFASGVYIKTEAGMTEYDKITITGKGTNAKTPTTDTVSADPTMAYGAVSLGFKF